MNFPFDALSLDGGDELSGYPVFDGKIKDANDNTYFALDPNWKDDSDSSTPRVQIAQGQSDITRHESYFKEEMSPNYKFEEQKELPDAFVYMRITSFAPKSTVEKNTPVLKINGGSELFVGTVEYIAGKIPNGVEDPNYYNLACRTIDSNGEYVYGYKRNNILRNTYFSGDAKIEVDLQSLNKMKFYNPESGEEVKSPIEKYFYLVSSSFAIETLDQESLDLLNSAKTLSTIREYPIDVHVCARIEGSNEFLGQVVEPNDNTWICISNWNTNSITIEPLNQRIRLEQLEFNFDTFTLPRWTPNYIDQDTPGIQWTNDGFISGKDEYLSLHGQFYKDGDEWYLLPMNTRHYIWHVDNTVIDTENTSPEKY